MFFWIICMLIPVMSQRLDIQDLSRSQGLLPMKLGPSRIIDSHIKLIHIVNLTAYEENIENIRTSVELINKNKNVGPMKDVTNLKFQELRNKLQSLLPRYRNKRGLINGIGSVIKAITGNMDSNDAEQINKDIQNLKTNEHDMNKELTKQVQINGKMIQRFANITNHINTQQKNLEDYLNKYQLIISQKIRSDEEKFQYMQYIYQINYNIEILTNHLQEIIESINLAKLNIISKHILNPNELDLIHEHTNSQNIAFSSDEQLYEFLSLEAYYNHTNIIFNIKLPILIQESFNLYHLVKLPVNQTLTINFTQSYAIMNDFYIQYMNEPCPIIEQTYYCPRGDLNNSTSDSCIPNIIKHEEATCEIIKKPIESSITQPEEGYLLLINSPNIEMTSTYGIKKRSISGTLLLHYEECEVKLNNVTYKNKSTLFWDKIQIIPSIFNKINNSLNFLDKLNNSILESTDIANTGIITLIDGPAYHLPNVPITYIIISILVVILIFWLICILKHHHYHCKGIEEQESRVDQEAPDHQQDVTLSWPSLHS